jgi:D-threo-aldose 1-dehydrogenase
MSIPTRPIGRTDVLATTLGVGTGPLRRPPIADAIASLETAWSAGIRYFDTAPWYGRGRAEYRLGRFLVEHCDEPFVLSTKVGRLVRPTAAARRAAGRTAIGDEQNPWAVQQDYTRDGILRSVEDSVQRLGVSAIDVALVHDLDLLWAGPEERMRSHTAQLLASGWRALQELKTDGVVRAIGFGINYAGLMDHWLELFDPDVFLIAGPYTLMDQVELPALNRCHDRGVGVVVGQPYASGLLATGPVPGATYNYHPATPDALEKARQLQDVCTSFDVPLAAAALQFPLGHPAVATVIPGMAGVDEARAAIDAFNVKIPDELWTAVRDQGLIAPDAPTPSGS